MLGREAYEEFKKLEKQVNEVRAIYNHLKSDIASMSDGQIKSQVTKILNRITKIDFDLINDYLEALKSYLIYDDLKLKAEEILKDIDEIKEYVYSLKKEEIKPEPKPEPKPEEDTTVPHANKLDIIRDKYTFLQKEIDASDTDAVIKDAKRLDTLLSNLNFEDLPEGDYEEMFKIKNEVSRIIKNLVGVEKSEKYGPYIMAPLIELIANIYTLGNKAKAEQKAATLLNFIEDPERIEMFEPAIKRIIAKKMTPKEFRTFYESTKAMIRGEKKFESFGKYKERNELFYLI
jgi:hypothetical protein